jgi:selT/selW/selH-like putative selenoprotein
LAAEIRRAHPGADVKLIASSGGRFEVVLNGKAIFEKSKQHRHAKPGEVLQLIASHS